MFLFGSLLLSIAVADGRGIASTNDNVSEYNTDEYCNPDLCKMFNGTHFVQYHHIGCGNNVTFSSKCDDAQMVDMNPQLIDLIVGLHNSGRNRTAFGKLEGYKSAAAMPVIKWDKELQFLAGLNVRTCHFDHDKCRNTKRFRFSGQNIGIYQISIPIETDSIRYLTKNLVRSWFYEFPDAGQEFIDSFKGHPEGKQIGHFTQMVVDRVKRVGCAANIYTTNASYMYNFLLTCNYDSSNLSYENIYKTGDPATNCKKGRNGRYQGLCDW